MAAIFFRCFATLVLALLVVVAAQNVQANDPTTKGLSNSTRLLFKAINENDLETARTAVSQGANVGAENSLGVRPVDLAVDLGHFEVAHFLLAINQTPAQKQEEIPLPPPVAQPAAPPVATLPPLTPPRQIAPPVLSGPQFSAPVFKPVPAPAIAPPVISPPVIRPPVISAPQVPSPIQAPTIPALTKPSAPTLGVPSIQAIPAPPQISPAPPANPAPEPSTAIKAPPEPPPLTNDDGTLVQTPKATPSASPASAVNAAAKGIATTPAVPKPDSGGFISNVWDSMTGWVPFTGDKNAQKGTPAKQVQPSRPTQVIPAPEPKKISKPVSNPVKEAPAKIAKEIPVKPTKELPAKSVKKAPAKVMKEAPVKSAQDTPRKPEKGFFSSAWDSMTGWVPFTGDKKETQKKATPTDRRVPFSSESSERSSKAPDAQDVAALPNSTPDEPTRDINDEVEARARAFAIAREQKDAEQKALQEKAVEAAKQRAEAELAPPAKPKQKIEPIINQKQDAAEFKQKVEQRRQIAVQQENRTRLNSESNRQTPEPTHTTKASSQIKVPETKPKIVSKVETAEITKPINEPVVLPNAKRTVFGKIGTFFKSLKRQDSEDKPETEIAEVKPIVKAKAPVAPAIEEKLPEEITPASENSASYANLPLPDPPPPVQAISISQNVNLIVGTKNNLGQKLNIELVEDNKCVAKTEQNILFCLERILWPDHIKKMLKSPLSLMGDDMAMIRYDGGKASQIHINFPTDRFDKLINYFEKKYGPPTEYPKILMHRIGAPSQENPTVRWRVANPAMGRDVILEIRKTDDLRSILPADGAGVVRLFSSGDQMIFRYVSTADIMLMRMKYSTTRRKKRPQKAR
jgi:hypothetical protein